MDEKYIKYITSLKFSSVQCYRILLTLTIKICTQAQLCNLLEIRNQHIARYIKELEALNLIEVDRIEGRNKFYKAVTELNKIQQKENIKCNL